MTLRHQLDSLIIYDPDRSSSTVNVWVAHPSPGEEQALGTLFVVSAIDSPGRANHEVISILQDELKQQYYQTTDQSIDLAFEAALQQTNRRLHQLILEGIGAWVDQAHIIIGVQWRDRLVLSSLGQMHAFMIRRERIHEILGEPVASKPNPLRLFDQLVQGQLQADDKLILSTPALLDYFSLEKIRRTLLDHSPSQATRALETTLLGTEARVAFAALVFALHQDHTPADQANVPPVVTPQVRQAPQLSMDQLKTQEQATEKLLSPSIWPAVKQTTQQLRDATVRIGRSILHRPPKRPIPNSIITPQKPAAPSPVRQRIQQTSQAVGGQLSRVASRLRPSRSSNLSLQAPIQTHTRRAFGITAWLNAFVLWFQNLAPRRRLSVVGIGLVALLLSTAIVRSTDFRPRQSPQELDRTIQAIEDRLTQAEAALLFGGDDLAQQHIDEANVLLVELPDRSTRDKERRDPLVQQVAALQQQLTKLTVLPDPEVVFGLASNFPTLRPRQLYLTDDQFIVHDPASQTSVVASRNDPSNVVAAQNSLDTGTPRTGAVVNDLLLFGTNREGFVELDPADQSWRPIDASLPGTDPFIQFVSYYRNRVYVLDPTNNQILRFNQSANSLGTGQSWLVEPADLEQARGAVVDGSIFVLQPGGLVEEYFAGRRTDFVLEPIVPALTDPTRIWTEEGDQRLYLVEPTTKRIILFDKNGQLVTQFQSSTWTDLRDVVANQSDKEAFVLSGTTVFRIPLP